MSQTKRLHLGCGTDIKTGYHNVDKEPLAGVDETVDLSEFPWPWPTDSASHIVAEHVIEHLPDIEATLRECARVLQPGGRLTVVMPIGQNAVADPDHEHEWLWDTPEYYCGARHWDVDVGLEIVGRSVSVHNHVPGILGGVYQRVIDAAQHRYGDGRWLFDLPATSGEFTVVFEV